MVVGSLVDHPLNGQKQTDIRLLKFDIALYDTLHLIVVGILQHPTGPLVVDIMM